MIYLEGFEEHNTYYTKINQFDIKDISKLSFNKGEIDEISKLINILPIPEFRYEEVLYFNSYYNRIYKSSDEWYYLLISNVRVLNTLPSSEIHKIILSNPIRNYTIYKCDQLDGLMKCLIDKVRVKDFDYDWYSNKY